MPPEVLEIAILPRSKADHERLGVALKRLAAEDTSFRAIGDHESGQTIIKGASEPHLERLVERVRREFKVQVDVGAPQVAYRETLARPVEVDYTHKKQSGRSGQFGRVKVQVAPGERGSGVQFFDEIKGGNIPREYIPSVEKGMREMAESGSLIGFPIIDFEIHLVDGAYHDLDSSALAFEITGRGAMREGAQRAGIKLLEPVMKVEVATPEAFLGDVIGVLNKRRGQIRATDTRGEAQVVVAAAPLSNLFGLEKELNRMTDDAAAVEIVFERYAVVQPNGDGPDDTFPAAAAVRA